MRSFLVKEEHMWLIVYQPQLWTSCWPGGLWGRCSEAAQHIDLSLARKLQARFLCPYSFSTHPVTWITALNVHWSVYGQLHKASMKDCKVMHIRFQPALPMCQVSAWERRQKIGLCMLLRYSHNGSSHLFSVQPPTERSGPFLGEKQNIPYN